MNYYPQSNDVLPGTWEELDDDGVRRATFTCPICGKTGTLYTHTIAPNGVVLPSVVCYSKCGFHEFICLEGWHE